MEQYKVRDNSAFERSFVALAAPSYEGKTQSAFVMRNVRPLYFVADPLALDENGNTLSQPIYYNYQSISAALLHYAKLDHQFIENDGMPTDKIALVTPKSEKQFLKVAGSYLGINHSETKFWTLGFLKGLVLDAKNYDPDQSTWMEYHANRKNLIVRSTSISELKKDRDFFKGYCLFLDEFTGAVEKVMIRNLARLLGLRCIVANTNAIIANCLDKSPRYSMSRTSGVAVVWSIVFTRLNRDHLDGAEYLINPVDVKNSLFITYPSLSENAKHLTVYVKQGIHLVNVPWKYEYTR